MSNGVLRVEFGSFDGTGSSEQVAFQPCGEEVTPGLAAIGNDSSSMLDKSNILLHPVTDEFLVYSRRDIPMSLGRVVRRLMDIVGAIGLGIAFLPLILIILVATRDSNAPTIFKHRRVGRNGQHFDCLKFRTMIPNADQVLEKVLNSDPARREEWVRDHKLRDDPRVTRLGGFLRRTSLDELPQLWNVLRGEMSLVGPRPITQEEAWRYGRKFLLYTMTKPGVTGLWQVSGRSNTDYRRRVAIDVYYVRNQRFLLDLWIMSKTIGVIVSRRGAY